MDKTSPANGGKFASHVPSSNDSSVQLLARKQAEFESLLAIQSERRRKEDQVRQEEQSFAFREEKIVRESYQLCMMKAAFHAEKINWKRAMEDELRQEEDTRRAMEDARRQIEDERRKQEDLAQLELESAVKASHERLLLVDRVEKERVRRWIEEDRVRALEDILIRQDVVDLDIHAKLREIVHKHFDSVVGYGVPTKEQVDAQLDAFIEILFPTHIPGTSASPPTHEPSNTLKLSSSGVVIEPPVPSEAPPSYQSAVSNEGRVSPFHAPQSPSSPPSILHTNPLPSQNAASPPPSILHTAPAQNISTAQPRASTTPQTPLKKSNIEVDDFAVLDVEEPPTKPNNAATPKQASQLASSSAAPSSSPFRSSPQPALAQSMTTSPQNRVEAQNLTKSPMSPQASSSAYESGHRVPPGRSDRVMPSDVGLDEEDPDFAFDLSIQSSQPLVLQEDWEVVHGIASDSDLLLVDQSKRGVQGSKRVFIEGESKELTSGFRKFREEHVTQVVPVHTKQLSKILSDAALQSIFNFSISDLNPFSKLVLSTRDTWDSCDQCGTYFDRMSLKQTCRTCHRNFCSKCGLFPRRLDLSVIMSRVPEHAQEIRNLFPKSKEDSIIEVKCCSLCDKALKYFESKDSHLPHLRSNFFVRQYEKASAAYNGLKETIQELDTAIREGHNHEQIYAIETRLNSAMRKYQSCIDSVDQTISTLRSELPINPKTGARYTNSAEIRTLTFVKTAMTTNLIEAKQIVTHFKIKLASKDGVSPKIDAAKIAASVRQHQS